MDINKVTLGEHIAQLRKSNDLTQNQLAKKLNVSFQAVSKWERGIAEPGLDTLNQLSVVFKTDLSMFLWDLSHKKDIDYIVDLINSKNYGIGGLRNLSLFIKSGAIDENFLKRLNNKQVIKVLKNIISNKENYNEMSEIKLTHKIFRDIADSEDLSAFISKIEVINDIPTIITEFEHGYSFPILRQICNRLIDSNEKLFIFISNFTPENKRINYVSMCSKNLVKEGLNCLMALSLATNASIKNNSINIATGAGGNMSWGHIDILSKEDLREDGVLRAFNIVKEYLNFFDKDYKLVIELNK